MKKAISVFLAVLMIAACMGVVFASAEAEKIDITGVKEPKVGDAPTVSVSSITISDGYTIKSVTYYEEELNVGAWDPNFETFQAGRTYRVVIVFEPNVNASFTELPVCTINGKTAKLQQYTGNVKYEATYVFGELQAPADPTPTDPTPAASVCKWCGGDHSNGFFQKIIGFFHNILAAILGAKY